jgi:hypothetical protein
MAVWGGQAFSYSLRLLGPGFLSPPTPDTEGLEGLSTGHSGLGEDSAWAGSRGDASVAFVRTGASV